MNQAVPAIRSRLDLARDVLRIEAEAVSALANRLGPAFDAAVALILASRGRVIVSGMGKSGHIARKIAATLASTGTPAFFVHPAEASHGDLGMIVRDDILIALSHSGESDELMAMVPHVKRHGAGLIAMTGNPASSLAREADIHLDAGVSREACPHNLAPTASTTAALALGDALAVVLLDARGFSADDFARSHPGGTLGRRLLTHVRDVMRPCSDVARASPETPLADTILIMSKGGQGLAAVCHADNQIAGIVTDGDLRRLLEHTTDLSGLTAGDIMKAQPLTLGADQLAVEAVEMMERHRINALLITDENHHLAGALNMHDLFRARVI